MTAMLATPTYTNRHRALKLAAETWGNSFDADQLVLYAKKFERYLDGETNASQS